MEPSTVTPLIVILGPTASGKTAAGIELAKRIGGEIICADSRTVYKGMDIGTAKPTLKEQQGVPHHLIDVAWPNERFTAADFKEQANQKIEEIWARRRFPIIVGGTGLYMDSVIFDFKFGSDINVDKRGELEELSTKQLVDLAQKHNINLANIDHANKRHLVRAIERGGMVEQPKVLRPNTLVCGISVERDLLKARIEARVEKMFSDGFMTEVNTLADKYGWENESMSGIGYRLAKSFFEGESSVEEVKQAFVLRDMSLAKRQMTWFKRNTDIKWFEDPGELIGVSADFSRKFKV